MTHSPDHRELPEYIQRELDEARALERRELINFTVFAVVVILLIGGAAMAVLRIWHWAEALIRGWLH